MFFLPRYQLEIFYTQRGDAPLLTWLNSFRDRRVRARIEQRIERLKHGNFGDHKTLKRKTGLYELRLDFGSGYRVYYGIKRKIIVVLLCGGDKSSQSKDIQMAEYYWAEECEHHKTGR